MQDSQDLYKLQSFEEEKFNTSTHAIGLLLSLVGLGALLQSSLPQNFGVALVSLIYGLSVVQLFAVSTYYHQCSHPTTKWKARIWDHCAIYVLIAGSYTPYMALTLGCWKGWGILLTVWSIAFFGVRYKCRSENPFGAKSVALYLLMGWLILLVWTPLTARLAPAGVAWLVAGGVVYSLGVPFYAWRSLRYSHGIWHLFVLAGAACHFVSVHFYVV